MKNLTVKEFIEKLQQYPEDKEVVITGYLPEYTYSTKIVKWIETEKTVEILTDIEK